MRKKDVFVRVCECEREDLSVTAKGKYADSKVKKTQEAKSRFKIVVEVNGTHHSKDNANDNSNDNSNSNNDNSNNDGNNNDDNNITAASNVRFDDNEINFCLLTYSLRVEESLDQG